MKIKILKLASIGFLTVVIIYSCNLTGGTVSIPTLTETICSNYSSMNKMEVELIHAMTEKYKTKQLAAINGAGSTRFNNSSNLIEGDSRAVWFDLEKLKKFIYHIEAEAKKHPTTTQSKDLGVRIYYASYPEYASWNSLYYKDLPGTGNNVLTQEYEDRHTLIMVPTIRRNGIEVDFNPLDPTTYYSDGMASYASGATGSFPALLAIPSSGPTGSENHGSLFPPHSETGLNF